MALIYIRLPNETKEEFEARKAAGEARELEKRRQREAERAAKAAEREAKRAAKAAERQARIEARQAAADARREDREDRMKIRSERMATRQEGRTARVAERREASQIREQGKADSGYYSPEAVQYRQQTAQTAIESGAGVVEEALPYVAAAVAAGAGADVGEVLGAIGQAQPSDAAAAASTTTITTGAPDYSRYVPWLVGGAIVIAALYAFSGNKGSGR